MESWRVHDEMSESARGQQAARSTQQVARSTQHAVACVRADRGLRRLLYRAQTLLTQEMVQVKPVVLATWSIDCKPTSTRKGADWKRGSVARTAAWARADASSMRRRPKCLISRATAKTLYTTPTPALIESMRPSLSIESASPPTSSEAMPHNGRRAS